MSHSAHYLPSPLEISKACRQIQQTWSEQERKTRAGAGPGTGWYPPGILRICRSSVVKNRLEQ
jgi:hypothetical protein